MALMKFKILLAHNADAKDGHAYEVDEKGYWIDDLGEHRIWDVSNTNYTFEKIPYKPKCISCLLHYDEVNSEYLCLECAKTKMSDIEGRKDDKGKIKLDRVLSQFARALEAVGKAGTFGIDKYSESGWLKVEDAVKRYKDAAARHKNKMDQGELVDKDSNLPHSYHYTWNVLAILDLQLREDEK